tara:strand:+ start:249 stop:542 length:294 start_codon:yes stop_codon:yes gene_type:complete
MKVKVNYTVELNDIPKLIEGILMSARQDLSDCASKLNFDPHNFNKMVGDYQTIRERLNIVDGQVEDVLNITSGWIQANQPSSEVANETTSEVISDEE